MPSVSAGHRNYDIQTIHIILKYIWTIFNPLCLTSTKIAFANVIEPDQPQPNAAYDYDVCYLENGAWWATNNKDPDQMQHYAATDLDLCCLQIQLTQAQMVYNLFVF